jgi:hypothetical protein
MIAETVEILTHFVRSERREAVRSQIIAEVAASEQARNPPGRRWRTTGWARFIRDPSALALPSGQHERNMRE